jgi:hypothetical protein
MRIRGVRGRMSNWIGEPRKREAVCELRVEEKELDRQKWEGYFRPNGRMVRGRGCEAIDHLGHYSQLSHWSKG